MAYVNPGCHKRSGGTEMDKMTKVKKVNFVNFPNFFDLQTPAGLLSASTGNKSHVPLTVDLTAILAELVATSSK